MAQGSGKFTIKNTTVLECELPLFSDIGVNKIYVTSIGETLSTDFVEYTIFASPEILYSSPIKVQATVRGIFLDITANHFKFLPHMKCVFDGIELSSVAYFSSSFIQCLIPKGRFN